MFMFIASMVFYANLFVIMKHFFNKFDGIWDQLEGLKIEFSLDRNTQMTF